MTATATTSPLNIDIVSDVVCPWCYIGLANLGVALDRFEHADDVEVVLHSYQLDPGAPQRDDQPLDGGHVPLVVLLLEVAVGEDLQFLLRRLPAVAVAFAHHLVRHQQARALAAHHVVGRFHGRGQIVSTQAAAVGQAVRDCVSGSLRSLPRSVAMAIGGSRSSCVATGTR